MVQKYVLDEIDDEKLKVFVVWGPMQGYETREHAEEAPAFLPDPRAIHYWTDAQTCAEVFEELLGLEDEPAWDTFVLFGAGARWQDRPPEPAYYMHVGKSLPKELRLDGRKLAEQVSRALAAAAPAAEGDSAPSER